jgi:hypothetical protein
MGAGIGLVAAGLGFGAAAGVGAEGGVAAAGPEAAEAAADATVKHFERQLAEHGVRSLEKSLQSLEERLAEHYTKLQEIREAEGFTSHVESEIATFQQQIEVIKNLVGIK